MAMQTQLSIVFCTYMRLVVDNCKLTRVAACTKIINSRVCMGKEYVRVVKWVRALALTLVAPVRIPVVCQSMLGVAYIQLTINNNCKIGIGLAYSLRIPLVHVYLERSTSSRVTVEYRVLYGSICNSCETHRHEAVLDLSN